MSYVQKAVGMAVVSLVLWPMAGFAVEDPDDWQAAPADSQPVEDPAAPKAAVETVPAPEADAFDLDVPEPAPAAPVAPPALRPITITFSGDLSAVSLTETPPMITVQDRYGVKKEIAVPAEAKVSAGGAVKAVSHLKVGDKLTVEYTYDVATGKRTAQSISIGERAPATS
jgi:hypothetical protein